MKKLNINATVAVFLLFIVSFFVISFTTEDKVFSEEENRYLQGMPAFSWEDVFSGDFMMDFETYITDQFPLRDTWVALKSKVESLLGKQENNGVYFASDGSLINRLETPDFSRVDTNIAAINKLIENMNIPVYLAVIPDAGLVWSEKLPNGAPNYDQLQLLSYINTNLTSGYIDIYSTLEEHEDEYIYYRTDHHWTTYGAYLAYVALGEAMGFDALPYPDETDFVASVGGFYGTIYSSSGVRDVEADIVDLVVNDENMTVWVNNGTGFIEKDMYEMSYADEKDKYMLFFEGNQPIIKIEGEGEGKLLIIKDSFANSLAPFLAQNYAEVHMIDLRFMKESVADYVNANEIDEVLLVYSGTNIAEDVNIPFVSR